MLRTTLVAMTLVLAASCSCGGGSGASGGGSGSNGGGATGTGGGSSASGGGSTSRPPTAAFTISAAPYTAGQVVLFDGSTSTDPDSDPLSFSWDFGDGVHGGGAKLSHTFAAGGTFTVKLTVSDPSGATGATSQSLTVGAGPQPAGQATLTLNIKEVSGAAISGAAVKAVGSPTGTVTDAMGVAQLMIGTQVRQTVVVSKAGYADKLLVFTLDPTLTRADQSVYLVPRAAAQMLDATAGGSLTGGDGIKLSLPADALVTESGAKVSGMVAVNLTPLDVVSNSPAFPGRFEGARTDGTQGLILSYGTAEFVFTQGTQRLQLAPGKTATIELPLYADRELTGAPLAPGATVPLWSLDERTGAWVEEGTGTVIASTTAPSGLAYRATVSHFSWWNSDAFGGQGSNPKPKCCIDGDADGKCDANGNPEYCWLRGTTNCASAFGCKAVNKLPAYDAEFVIPGAGGVVLPVPADTNVYFLAASPNATHRGQLLYVGDAGASDEPVILLQPFDAGNGTGTMVTVPSTTMGAIFTPADVNVYEFTAQVGEVVHVAVSRPNGSMGLEGTVSIQAPDAFRIDGVVFGTGGTAGIVGRAAIKAHVAGTWRVEVRGTKYVPGNYTLQLLRTGPSPYIASFNPAPGASGLPTSTRPSLVMSGAVSGPVNSTMATLDFITASVPGTTVAADAGATLTFIPGQLLSPGTQYRTTIKPPLLARPEDGGSPDGFRGTARIPFRTAEVLGEPALCSLDPIVDFSVVTDRGVRSAGFWDSNNAISSALYQPGTGWLDPVVQRGGRTGKPSVASSGDEAALAYAGVQVPGMLNGYQLFLARLTDAGWSNPVALTFDAGQLDPGTQSLALEPNGRTVLAWRGSTVEFWAMQGTPAAGFSPAKQLFVTDVTAPSNAITAASNAGKDLVVFRAYQADAGGAAVTHAARFDGTTWDGDFVLEGGNASSMQGLTPAVDGEGNMLALWHASGNWTATLYRADAGWQPPAVIEAAGTSSFCTDHPPLVVGRPHGFVVAACDATPDRVVFSRAWDPATATWGATTVLSTPAMNVSQFEFSQPSGEAAVMWWRDSGGPLQWRALTNGTWSAPSSLPNAPLNLVKTSISSIGKVMFTWETQVGGISYSGALSAN
ncbi:MAG: PKD domain-containing protein [Myxococcaceae bacterium]|nr:PKD domain-containing protein [Myxococcaceae bacterium]